MRKRYHIYGKLKKNTPQYSDSDSDSDSDICLLATLMELYSLHRHIIKLFYTLKIEVIYKNVLIL